MYNFKKIEKKWQRIWEATKIYEAKDKSKKPKWYSLIEFPYPSGAGLHVGHVRSKTAMDIISRKRRMEGYNVLYPIGWDAFGLPTENYAIKTGTPPAKVTKQNTDIFRRQLKSLGFSFDWSREIDTTDPNYYKWTQWIFLQLFKKGLAYKTRMPINWCPKDKIGLANEEVVGGNCERCGTAVEKREKEQWMLKITAYAEKLLEGLKDTDFLDVIKTQQTNWIGQSEGAEINFELRISNFETNSKFKIQNSKFVVKVFTTRPDTLFGTTYLVLAPEHQIIESLKLKIENYEEIQTYINVAKKKTEMDRSAEGKEKTGVKLEGVSAINPATNEEIPIFVADYVLGGYGTGAIMAVPAHDERDFEFAKKYSLPIKQVVRPVFGIENKKAEAVHRDTVSAIVLSKDRKKILMLKLKDSNLLVPIIGGIDSGETALHAAEREVLEETGYKTRAVSAPPAELESYFYADHKKEWRSRIDQPVLLELVSERQEPITEEEANKHEIKWLDIDEALAKTNFNNTKLAIELALSSKGYVWSSYSEGDHLINSGSFTGMKAEDAKKAITDSVEGKMVTKYKLRDWVFSRQRYWGEPIPIIHCADCGYVPVPEKDLPVELPKVQKYEPTDTGESPLSAISSWVKVKCPTCKKPARRETDVMPNWAGSSWYFLRYIDPKNKKAFADFKKLKYFMPVDWYNGGMEHVTLHLLYSRFWNQFLYDEGHVPVSEPYKKRTFHGLILGEGGIKMSKSKGNVINPDDVTKIYGADALRMYEMFMGPFDQAIAWDTKSIEGVSRFLGRIWNFSNSKFKIQNSKLENQDLEILINKTIKKVSADIEAMGFNTAISALMIFLNDAQKQTQVSKDIWEKFLLLIAPFAPHITEELWEKLGNKKSIHLQAWPKYDEALTKDASYDLVIQINGKFRAKINVMADIGEGQAKELAKEHPLVLNHLKGKNIVKVVFVSGRLINFVI